MITRTLFTFLLACWFLICSAQQTSTNRTLAYLQLKDMKEGVLVVRLKTNDRSVQAYRNAGRNDIADRIVRDQKNQNIKIVKAFRQYFNFCPVYFIHSRHTDSLKQGSNRYFLTDSLTVDTSIRKKDGPYFIAEYGTLMANLRSDEYHYSAVNKTESSSTATTTSAILIMDTALNQLREPFPFYQTVYMENYNKAVDKLNKGLQRAYFTQVQNAEIRKQLRK